MVWTFLALSIVAFAATWPTSCHLVFSSSLAVLRDVLSEEEGELVVVSAVANEPKVKINLSNELKQTRVHSNAPLPPRPHDLGLCESTDRVRRQDISATY